MDFFLFFNSSPNVNNITIIATETITMSIELLNPVGVCFGDSVGLRDVDVVGFVDGVDELEATERTETVLGPPLDTKISFLAGS